MRRCAYVHVNLPLFRKGREAGSLCSVDGSIEEAREGLMKSIETNLAQRISNERLVVQMQARAYERCASLFVQVQTRAYAKCHTSMKFLTSNSHAQGMGKVIDECEFP